MLAGRRTSKLFPVLPADRGLRYASGRKRWTANKRRRKLEVSPPSVPSYPFILIFAETNFCEGIYLVAALHFHSYLFSDLIFDVCAPLLFLLQLPGRNSWHRVPFELSRFREPYYVILRIVPSWRLPRPRCLFAYVLYAISREQKFDWSELSCIGQPLISFFDGSSKQTEPITVLAQTRGTDREPSQLEILWGGYRTWLSAGYFLYCDAVSAKKRICGEVPSTQTNDSVVPATSPDYCVDRKRKRRLKYCNLERSIRGSESYLHEDKDYESKRVMSLCRSCCSLVYDNQSWKRIRSSFGFRCWWNIIMELVLV